HLHPPVACLDLSQRLPRCPEAVHEPREHRNERDAHEPEHERLLREYAPCPAGRSLTEPDGGDEREAGKVQEQRLPGLTLAEVERRLERRDQIRDVQQVSGRSERV